MIYAQVHVYADLLSKGSPLLDITLQTGYEIHNIGKYSSETFPWFGKWSLIHHQLWSTCWVHVLFDFSSTFPIIPSHFHGRVCFRIQVLMKRRCLFQISSRQRWSGSWIFWMRRTVFPSPATSTLLLLFTASTKTTSDWRWGLFFRPFLSLVLLSLSLTMFSSYFMGKWSGNFTGFDIVRLFLKSFLNDTRSQSHPPFCPLSLSVLFPALPVSVQAWNPFRSVALTPIQS